MRRRKRQMELGIVALALTALALSWVILCIAFWNHAVAASVTTPVTPSVITSHQPDISHCFADDETRELWDCIRHVPKEVSDVSRNDE